ncbi:MAG: PRD domain-containing protein [Peptoniphilaceae bacterium]|nr:PRD domain-containing protein [Peptoniphilaceae bacterium]MDY6018556.1 PRD domain-containing protein [Anaerococcus sp.]
MKPTKLSQRQKKIINILAQSNKSYIIVKDIADKLNMSIRTVQRDLVGIEDFLDDNDFTLIKKPGHGLMLNESKESVDFLYELLDMVDSSKQYEKTERVNFILSRLLTSKQPIKSFSFTVYLDISERTLVEDLNFIEKWLSLYDLKLIRKRGEGISIEGAEKSIRKAQARLINEVLNDDKKIEILRNINDKTKLDLIKQNDILAMIDRDIIKKTRLALNRAFDRLKISISDNSYVGLLVHISLAIERLKQDKILDCNEDIIKDLKDTKEYDISKIIIKELEKEFRIDIPDIEIYFIAMHIKATKIIDENTFTKQTQEELEAISIGKALILEMEKIYKLDLPKDHRLEKDLTDHLIPAISRLKFNFPIKNPILEDIKENYKTIFTDLKNIGNKIIKPLAKLDLHQEIPDDEIGYIAIHFINAIEGKIVDKISINALTVCPTGYATSKLLATNIIKHFSNVNIAGNASVMEINKQYLKDKNIDLIISTIDIDHILSTNQITDVTYLQMPAIPEEENYYELSKKIREISRNKYYAKHEIENKVKVKVENKPTASYLFAKNMYQTSIELEKLYRSIKFISVSTKDNLEESVARSLADDEDEKVIIKSCLEERNKLSPTYYQELNLHLLHGKCSIKNSKLAFGKVKNPDQNIIVMLLGDDNQKAIRDLFSAISTRIVENKEFLMAIDRKDWKNIENMVINIIYELLEEKINLRRKNNES